MSFEDYRNVNRYLIRYGYHHLMGISADEANRIDEASVYAGMMLARYQSFFWEARGIQPDGKIGPVTRAEMEKPRCRCPDIADPHQASADRWPDPCARKLKVWCDKSGLEGDLSTDEFEALWYKQFEETRRVCHFDFEIVENEDDAHYIGWFERMGGGTLAWSEFPSTCSGQSQTRSNSKVDWSYDLFQDTSLHEQGHGLGLPHGPAGNVMYWTVDRDYDGKWQNWDTKQLVRRYGEPQPVEPGPTPSPPTAPHRVEIDGVLYVPATSPGPIFDV